VWRRSSRCVSEDNCVEVDWIKSSYSADTANCVQWRTATGSHENGACVQFRTSTYSVASECVEWATSTYSAENGCCVQVAGCDCAGLPHVALVRDSKEVDADGNNTSPVLTFDASNWRRFIRWAPEIGAGCG
jgi:hypothetical protein